MLAFYARARGAPSAASAALLLQRRRVEYWGSSVTGRTQPFAQGDMLPRLDNTRNAINKSSSAAASITGNHLGIAYDGNNIFSVEEYSRLEKEHYQPLRGVSRYKVEPINEGDGLTTQRLMLELEEDTVVGLDAAWWGAVFKDFPSLKKPCTSEFKAEFADFYKQALGVAHDEAAVTALAVPFVRRQMQTKFISFPMFWRIAEKLSDALVTAAAGRRHEMRVSRIAVERVTKIALNTIADEPWAHKDTTSPLLFDVSNFRAWHEAGNW
ncbi:putative NADH-ubiquinone oxidoreductase complex I subunit [Trypanosoma cruzi]|uniref:NADH-ubiquinone oxidoreductase complex I subunit n=2 Tax=Trypanosoma cruzi TaxID=5693 RepID=Q4DHQ0_TRYCC|nr:hypothetical protein, conserved [Trypanosoma cruzi]EAN92065.1 hypothetical protein, conserved [Trypanosoma cruzi]KAF5221436.1 hypothetical protein ECC02_005498 [Trypanosoma cruzi]KAF8293152.1 putative NADH-ubiquinone oxidoreductase complex I subunit [Trypanosoma cruzi]PWV07909.1 putative NADH-ubiquinone oxidoreductase complex I subunit [Trypanosoma cruzi]RNC59640.1 hypothetical protein TcCL_ESM02700 [Trypanosoma cruzi]|eukprot:XP_813916.1 hypothetical protein [Trypanosoma cruzi strain CL Brener]